ncbi:MAG: glycosyltransferase family 39 protein [Acidimicrobiia bacterium]
MQLPRGTRAIVGVGVVAAVVRIAFAIDNANADPAVDSDVYRWIARNLADGAGYVLADSSGKLVPTAQHPPMLGGILAAFDVVGLTTELQQRIALSLVAAIGVVLTGFVARHVAGATAGVIAAAIAALHPLWFQHAGFGVSESVYLVVIPLVLLLGVRAADRPSWQRMAALGAALGVAALTRSEGVLFLIVLVVPLVIVVCPTWKARGVAALVAAAAMLLVITPWVVRNYEEFDGFTLSTNRGVTLAGSWCPSGFGLSVGGRNIGGWDLYCVLKEFHDARKGRPPAGHDTWDELAIDNELTSRSLDFGWEHLEDVPGVVAARVGRMLGVYKLDDQLDFDRNEGRDRNAQRTGQILHLFLLPFAILGVTRLAKRYLPVFLAGPVVAVLVAMAFYGSTRIRAPAEPTIAVLAAIGILTVQQWIVRSRAEPVAR